MVLHDSGTAANDGNYGWWYGYEINAAFDICQEGSPLPNPTVPPLGCENKIYIQVSGHFIILTLDGDNYGDVIVSIIDGIYYERYNSSDYEVDYIDESDLKTLTLKNDFGGDRNNANVKGKMIINSGSINDLGYTSQKFYSENSWFPHYLSAEDNQDIANYYRKWRNWNSVVGDSNISKTLSTIQDYNITAKYARKCNIAVQNDFGASGSGGNIKFQSVQYSSPYQPSLTYDDLPYSVEALNTTLNSTYYTFNHWEFNSSNIGTQNPKTNFTPTAHDTLKAKFNGKPVNNYRNLTINFGQYGQNVQLAWNKHPLDNSEITQYAIWRKVESNPAAQIGTVNANGSASYSFTDYDYVISNSVNKELLKYDVRAYYSPSGTYPDADWLSVYGEMMAKINQDPLVQEIMNELPTEYSISNYPNPFNPTTTISYQLPDAGLVTLKVYDILGKEVAELVNETKVAGYYEVRFGVETHNGASLPSGVYIYTIRAGKYIESKKMIFAK